MSDKASSAAGSGTTYHLQARWVIVAIVIAETIYGIVLDGPVVVDLVQGPLETNFVALLVLVLLLLIALILTVFLFVLALQTRIVVLADGIAYYTMVRRTVSTPWSNVERIASLKVGLLGETRTFVVLHEPPYKGWGRQYLGLAPEMQWRVIPLSGGWRGWAHHADLLADVKRHAPQAAAK